MLTFSIAIIAMLAVIAVLATAGIKGMFALYKQYKYITSAEFKAFSQNLPRKEKLNYTYNGFNRLIGILFFLLLAVFIVNAPIYVLLLIAAALIWSLNCNSKIAKELGKV